MSNENQPGDEGRPGPAAPHESHPTEPLWPVSGAAPGARPPGQPAGAAADDGGGAWGPPVPGGPPHGGPRTDGGPSTAAPSALPVRYKGRHRAAAIAAVALLAAGGAAAAAVAFTGHSAPAASRAAAGPQGGGAAGLSPAQGAALNDTLNTAGTSPLMSAAAPAQGLPGAPAAVHRPGVCARARHALRAARRTGSLAQAAMARSVLAKCRFVRHRIRRFLVLRGVDGQVTLHTRKGLRTLAFERGVIQSVTPGTSVVVRASDGTLWAWNLTGETVVRNRTGKLPASSLAVGQPVWVGGPVISGAKDARLIVVKPPTPGSRGS